MVVIETNIIFANRGVNIELDILTLFEVKSVVAGTVTR